MAQLNEKSVENNFRLTFQLNLSHLHFNLGCVFYSSSLSYYQFSLLFMPHMYLTNRRECHFSFIVQSPFLSYEIFLCFVLGSQEWNVSGAGVAGVAGAAPGIAHGEWVACGEAACMEAACSLEWECGDCMDNKLVN